MVCQGSCYQQALPFFERETAHLYHTLFERRWVQWAGLPNEMVMVSARINLGETLQKYLDDQGVTVRPIPAQAHWQLPRGSLVWYCSMRRTSW